MAEQEAEHSEALTQALFTAAGRPEGFTVQLAPEQELRLALSGHGELTLWVSGKAEPEAAPAQVSSTGGRREGEQERIRLTGRVASSPRYAPLRNRGLRVGFTLAEHPTDGETIFHSVYSTGDFARRIQRANPQLGEEVSVEGVRQQRTEMRSGRQRQVTSVYCYGLRIASERTTLP